jgi:hypothetical protein
VVLVLEVVVDEADAVAVVASIVLVVVLDILIPIEKLFGSVNLMTVTKRGPQFYKGSIFGNFFSKSSRLLSGIALSLNCTFLRRSQ